MSTVLKAENIWFSYDQDKSFILRGADIEVRKGVVTMMLGRSGSGKTTLLKLLANLLKPQKGNILHQGCVAYIPQALGLVHSMTALENTLVGALGSVGTWRSILRLFPDTLVQEASATLASLGLEDKLDKKVSRLSGGERQRVAIARALMQKPDFILADEFVSQLDLITADEILSIMKKLALRGTGFLVTTHDIEEVEHYADEFKVVQSGKIACQGAVSEFEPQVIRRLLKNETINS